MIPGTKIGGCFIIQKKIGSGSFGQIYVCKDSRNNKNYAMKIESLTSKFRQLAYEAYIYKILNGFPNVPHLHLYKSEKEQNILIVDLLGKSLESIISTYKKISLKTVIMLFEPMINSIQYLHQRNFIHRDIKPDNFVVGLGSKQSQLYLIDFGLAKRFRDPLTLQHMEFSDGKKLTGTARYASVNVLSGIEPTRRDDLESLGYVLIYLLNGDLPWTGLSVTNSKDKYAKIRECKKNISLEELCYGLPIEFLEYFKAIRSLKYDEEPKYNEYRSLFRNLLINLGYSYDSDYEWINKSLNKPDSDCSKMLLKSKSGSFLLSSPVSVKVHYQESSYGAGSDFEQQMNDLKKLLNVSSSSEHFSEELEFSRNDILTESKSNSYYQSIPSSTTSSYSLGDDNLTLSESQSNQSERDSLLIRCQS
ncbi:Casein kinase I isoform delta-like protein [Tritrichomonas foetus]|uniref:non-specific serine/threonine protein kinase n=1 Tax=Tritrichomonas foetus TaxID=1144522 RepID=A0A1J4JU12_9EUKA|nr:Casein kinase I isoform delta-like protein [Tritrichomonas foetus]|eukprot:OHT01006.1 Casein kinase I isoform delta-like protein [Tritrichomonas foetus]